MANFAHDFFEGITSSKEVVAPQTISEVIDMLAAINLAAPSIETISEIGIMDGQRFKSALVSVLKHDDNWRFNLTYLENITYATSSSVKRMMLGLGFPERDLSIKKMIAIGISEGGDFRKHLVNASRNGQPVQDMQYLKKIIAVSEVKLMLNTQPRVHDVNEQFNSAALSAPEIQKKQQPNVESHRQQSSNSPIMNDTAMNDFVNSSNEMSLPKNVTVLAHRKNTEKNQDFESGEFISRYVYGKSNAICLNADEKKGGEKAVRLEAAASIKEKEYNWKEKISLQLTHQEMMGFYCVLMGWIPNFEGKGHGFSNEKSFTIKIQNDDFYKFYISVNCKGIPSRSVPVSVFDAFRFATLIFNQMLKNDAGIEQGVYLEMIKNLALLTRKSN
jgi:hypothetical protein